MKKRKICVSVFSRANYARIKTVLASIKGHPDLELLLIVGGPALLWRFGDIRGVLKKDGFNTIDAEIYSIVEGENPITMTKSVGLGIIELATTFASLEPDIVVTVADRFETMATAIADSYITIPLCPIICLFVDSTISAVNPMNSCMIFFVNSVILFLRFPLQ